MAFRRLLLFCLCSHLTIVLDGSDEGADTIEQTGTAMVKTMEFFKSGADSGKAHYEDFLKTMKDPGKARKIEGPLGTLRQISVSLHFFFVIVCNISRRNRKVTFWRRFGHTVVREPWPA